MDKVIKLLEGGLPEVRVTSQDDIPKEIEKTLYESYSTEVCHKYVLYTWDFPFNHDGKEYQIVAYWDHYKGYSYYDAVDEGTEDIFIELEEGDLLPEIDEPLVLSFKKDVY
jgi:hypothetical protein